jgi:hypothetical protein
MAITGQLTALKHDRKSFMVVRSVECVNVSHCHPSLIFAGKAGAYSIEAPYETPWPN